MLIRLAVGVLLISLLGSCAAGPALQQPPDDLQHPKPANQGGGGGY